MARASSLEHRRAVGDTAMMRVTNRGSTSRTWFLRLNSSRCIGTLNGTGEVKNSGLSDPPEWDAFPLPPPRGKGALIRSFPDTTDVPIGLVEITVYQVGRVSCVSIALDTPHPFKTT